MALALKKKKSQPVYFENHSLPGKCLVESVALPPPLPNSGDGTIRKDHIGGPPPHRLTAVMGGVHLFQDRMTETVLSYIFISESLNKAVSHSI